MKKYDHSPKLVPRSRRFPTFFLTLTTLTLLLAGCNRTREPEVVPVPTFTPTAQAAVSGDVTGVPVAGAPVTQSVQATTAITLSLAATTQAAAEIGAQLTAPVPTAVPAAVPTPTAVPAADELLAKGREQLRFGDYAAARATLQQAITSAADNPQLRLSARYDLARALLAEGLYAEALAALDALDADATASGATAAEFLSKDQFLRAQALSGAGDQTGAIAAYWKFLETYPWMAFVVQPRIGEAYLALGDVEGAATAFRRASETATDTLARVQLLERVARSYTDVGRYGDAAAAYDEILTVAQNPGYRAQMLYAAGNALSSAGDGAGAINRWQRAAAEAPTVPSAYLALVELVNREVDFDLYQRGLIDLAAEAWLPAVSAYEAYLAGADVSDARYANALHGLGQAWLGAGDSAAAITAFDRVISEFPQCDCFGRAWLDKARAQIASGDAAAGRRTYRTFARDHAADALAPEALWQSGVRAVREGNEVEAAIDFLALAESFPQSARAADALYYVAMGAQQQGFYGQAVVTFARVQSDYPDYKWPAVIYWLGRAHQANGSPDEARAQWQALVERAPDIYYGILSAQALQQLPLGNGSMLENIKLVAGPPSRLDGDDGSQAFAERWLQGWDLFAGVTNPGQLSEALAVDADLAQARLLLELDQRADAVDSLERVYQRYKDDATALYPLSLEFARMGAFRHSIVSMARFLQFSPAGLVENAPIFMQRKVYPLYFEELITREAQANNMDPFLYYSMIRQESLFEEGARSYAAAQGLAQIIPDTARWVAERKGHPDWSNELIYRPYINVNFGAYYFNWVRDYLDGNPVSALVGYNAGPGNSQIWRELSGPDDTLFVEMLGVNEPRLYVQLITENLYHYTRLYG